MTNKSSKTNATVEAEAEAFAYELLMPTKMFWREILKAREANYDIFRTVEYLSKIFGVEEKRVWRRLEQIND